jgi:predicted nucleic acid-binding protein
VTYLLDTSAISDLMRADQRVERWLAELEPTDRVVVCTIARREILFGISRLPEGRRKSELQELGRRFLEVFYCESVPERAGDFYASLKLLRQLRGLSLDENDLWIAATAIALDATLVSRDADFVGIDGLRVVMLA